MLPINVTSANTESFISRITSKEVIQPTVTLTLLFFFQNWTGFVATIFYGVDIFMVSTTFMGISSPAPAEEFLSPMPSFPSLEWDYFLLGLLCKLRRVTLGICQTPDEISHACCAEIYSKMRSQIITCRVVLTVPPDFQYPNENNLLSHWQISWLWAAVTCFLFWYWKLGGALESIRKH